MITLTNEQRAIDKWVTEGRGNAVINAVAGAGKSTQIRRNVKMVKGRRVLISFNAHIAKENSIKINDPQVESRTLHSLGMEVVRGGIAPARLGKPDEYKYANMVKYEFETRAEANLCVKLFDLCRVSLTSMADTNAISALVEHHGLENVTHQMVSLMLRLEREGIKGAQRGVIDFTDMIWIPVVMNMKPLQFDWVFGDEIQDFSPMQTAFITKLLAPGGRFVGVGDPRQAIYGFAGAGANSFYEVRDLFQAQELSLSVTFRCPISVVALAQLIVPQIQARENAPLGNVINMLESQLVDNAKDGDLVLCRMTAPLIAGCLQLIGRKVPARVRGREIGKTLTSVVLKVAKLNGGEFSLRGLAAWSDKEVLRLDEQDNAESAIEQHLDKMNGIKAIYNAYADGPDYSTADFCADIESLFSDAQASVLFSTVHKAKGLEYQRVFIMKPSKLPFYHKNMTGWQKEQEKNLEYVAITRAMDTLVYLTEED